MGLRSLGRSKIWLAAAGAAAAIAGVAPAAAAQPASPSTAGGGAATSSLAAAAGDGPAGFWYGTDSWPMPVSGSGPYREPVIGGAYGGYIGMTGSWAHWIGCHTKVAWSAANSRQAKIDFSAYHLGVGTGVYWFMGGPGVDPHYNGTTKEAYAWGRLQAERTLHDISLIHITYPVVFMDVELPGYAPSITPAPDNGWNAVYTSPCSGKVKKSYIDPNVDRAVLTGFAGYLGRHSSYSPGVYSAASVWRDIFGAGTPSVVTRFYEWTYVANTSSLAHHPSGWCLAGTSTCAHFFGGVSRSSPLAVMWQWSGGGGAYNGYGDFDQIDANRTPS